MTLQPLLPLIKEPKNKKQRKEAARRLAVALDHHREVARIGVEIEAAQRMITGLTDIKQGMICTQLYIARELKKAGAPMEGVLWKQEE